MLSIIQIEEIETLCLKLPDLVRQQEQRSVDFVRNAGAWLETLEKALSANRLYQAGNVASIRSGLIAVQQGQSPEQIAFRSPPSHSRAVSAAAAHALQRAAEMASNLIAENKPRFNDADRIAQQIMAAAVSRGLIPARDEGISNTQYLRLVRRVLATVSDLENAAIVLEGLVGPQDTLIFIDRALTRFLKNE